MTGSIGLIKRSLAVFFKKENFKYFLKVQLPLLPFPVIALLHSYVLINYAEKFSEDLLTSPMYVTATVIFGLLNALAYLLVAVASYEAIQGILNGVTVPTKELFASAKRKMWKFFLMNLLKGLVIGLGFILLIIPGIVFSVWFAFSAFEMVLKGAGIKESLSRSRALVKGKFWAIVGRFAVIGIFAFALQILVSLIPYGVGNIVTPFLGILFILPTYLLYVELQNS